MGYYEIATMAEDQDLTSRVRASAAQEVDADPYTWTNEHMLQVCAQPGWDEAWSSAVAAGTPNPGRDPAVISDGMILSATQAVSGP